MPPYALPDNHTQMALQSSSSPGGGGTNELRMQDGSGGMELFLHASRDLHSTVGNDLLEDITAASRAEVGLCLDTQVGADQTLSVGATQKLTVTAECIEETTSDKQVVVNGAEDWGTKKNHSVTVEGGWNETVSGVMNVLANEVQEHYNDTYERKVGAALCMNAVTDINEAVGGRKTELIGGAKLELITK